MRAGGSSAAEMANWLRLHLDRGKFGDRTVLGAFDPCTRSSPPTISLCGNATIRIEPRPSERQRQRSRQDSRYSTRFSRYSSATGPITVPRQERQIVQS